MKYVVAQHSSPGTRAVNQDRVACAEYPGRVLLALADGLGGYDGGEIAAQTVIDAALEAFRAVGDGLITDPPRFLVLALFNAHRRINEDARLGGREDSPPRSTGVLCLVQNGYAYWAHVGDSRLYHLRGGEVLYRTLDDTTSERMRLDGVISEDEMRDSAWHGHLVQCIGGRRRPRVHLGSETALEGGDLLVLCSDGAWRACDGQRLARGLAVRDPGGALAELLTDGERRMRADCDNLSAVLLRFDDARPDSAPLLRTSPDTLDQGALWRAAQISGRPRGRPRAAPAGAVAGERDSIDAAIEELESFVSRLERSL